MEDKMRKRGVLYLILSLIFLSSGTIFPQTYEFVLQWGSNGTGNSEFNGPDQIAIDSSDNVYVADYFNDRIQVFTPDGTFITKWTANGASGVAVDSSGNVYVSDYDGNHIRKYTSDGTLLTMWGSNGTANGKFDSPWGIDVDSANNVYVADYGNNRIQTFTPDGIFITKWGANGAVGVDVDSSDNVYVSDYDGNHIQKFTADGTLITMWGSYGTGNGKFDIPWGVAVDAADNVYVADYGNNRIQKFTPESTFITKWEANGATGVAVNSSGDVYVSDWDNDCIRKFSPVTIPTVSTSSVTSITLTSAVCGGNVTSDGRRTVTAKGVCWSTSASPTTSDSKTVDGTGTGSFTSNITDLSPNTTYFVRAYATNSIGTAYGTARSFTTSLAIPPEIYINQNQLNFGYVLGGNYPPAQAITISNTGGGTLNWTVSDNADWLSCNPASGTGSAVVTVSIDPSGMSAGTYTGIISFEDTNASNSPQTVNVSLVIYRSGSTSGPFGSFDTPINDSTVRSSVPVTGWVLDDIGVDSVKIYRADGKNLVYIGDAVFVEGARPDIEQAYPGYPMNYQAGWGYMMLTNFLPNNGNGTFTFHAIATDIEGNQVTLGTKTVTVDNANAVKPFGAIDTPTQGGTATGSSFVNWGWVLTPQPNSIPTDGSTIDVWVDGINLGHPTYNIYREDIATLFPDYNNSAGAIGNFYLDTTTYEDGVHTIAWTAADNAGNTDGIGSRYFSILNSGTSSQKFLVTGHWPLISDERFQLPVDDSSPVEIIRGFNRNIIPQKYYIDDYGFINVEINELERVEVRLFPVGAAGPFIGAPPGTPLYTGFQMIGNKPRPLPIGSTLDTQRGIFYWQPGPGFIGLYNFLFIREEKSSECNKKIIPITIKITPKSYQK
jgi:streptogramin lyase